MGGGAAVAATALLPEDALVMHDIMEMVPCLCSTLGTVPCVPQRQGQSVGPSSREEMGYKGMLTTLPAPFPLQSGGSPGPVIRVLLWLSTHKGLAGQELNLSKLRKGKETQILKSWTHFWGKELWFVAQGSVTFGAVLPFPASEQRPGTA